MLRISRSSLTWLAIMGLMSPVAARADLPAVFAVQPASATTKPADSSAAQTSYYADDAPAETDLTPSASEAPAAFQQATVAPAPAAPSCTTGSSMSSVMASCLGDCRGRCWQPFVGIEAVLLAPVTNKGGGNDSYSFGQYTTASFGTPNPVSLGTNTSTASSVNGMTVTPRIWAGVMGECWGVGVRYWRFANTSGGETYPAGINNSSVFQQGALKLQTFDLEAIRRFCCCGNQMWFTGGVRYGQFTRNSTVQGTDVVRTGLFAGEYAGAASSGSGFNGVGPTVSLNGLKPLGCGGCWNLFYSARGSYLYSDNSRAFVQNNAMAVGALAPTDYNAGYGSGNGNAWIGELQLGLQYNHALQCFPGTAFFRIAGEYQYWHVNNTSASAPNSFAGFGTLGPGGVTTGVITQGSAGNSTLALLGFGISTGFMW